MKLVFVQREKQLSHCHTVTHASLQISEKCDKSRLVTTSAIKHFIAKVAYFYLKSGVLLGARTYNVVETRRQGDKEFKEFKEFVST